MHHIFVSNQNDPHVNLAWEDYLFEQVTLGDRIFYLWQNAPVIVIGRHQNPFVELDTKRIQEKNVFLARRPTGGGAVYHDKGNVNFTFISYEEEKKGDLKREQRKNTEVIIEALASLGLKVEATGRNDLEIDNRKFSGNAFREKSGKVLHHGTIMLDVKLDDLTELLTPPKIKIEAKGIRSVRSRVANLCEFKPELDYPMLCDALEKTYREIFQTTAKRTPFVPPEQTGRQSIDELIALYKSEAWQYGKSPQFRSQWQTKLSWGLVDLHLDIKNGEIAEVLFYSDALDVELVDLLIQGLNGAPFSPQGLSERFKELQQKNPEWKSQIEELGQFLLEKIAHS